eukprot:9479742-Pyramimonas_sp.AAC.2
MRSRVSSQNGLTGFRAFSSRFKRQRALKVKAGSEAALTGAAKRVDRAARGFRRAGIVSFWTQLSLTVVSSVIVVFVILYRTVTQVIKQGQRIANAWCTLMNAHAATRSTAEPPSHPGLPPLISHD